MTAIRNGPSAGARTAPQRSGGADRSAAERGADRSARRRSRRLVVLAQESNWGIDPRITQPNSDGDAGPMQQRTLSGWYGTLAQVNDPFMRSRSSSPAAP